MAGKLEGALAALVCLAAAVLIIGALLGAEGATASARPVSFESKAIFRDETTLSTALDPSRTVAFTFSLTTDQPWIGESAEPYSLTLAASPGSNVSRIQMGTVSVFLCDPQCTNSHFLYDDIEPLNETAPLRWSTYPGMPHLLNQPSGGAPVYITFNLAMNVFYAGGNHSSVGWDSLAYLGPLTAVPDNAATGRTMTAWGVVLLVPTSATALLRAFQRRRTGP